MPCRAITFYQYETKLVAQVKSILIRDYTVENVITTLISPHQHFNTELKVQIRRFRYANSETISVYLILEMLMVMKLIQTQYAGSQ